MEGLAATNASRARPPRALAAVISRPRGRRLASVGDGGLAVDAAGGAGREGTTDGAQPQAVAEVGAVEPGAQEAGVEGIAGAGRVHWFDRDGRDTHERTVAPAGERSGGAELDRHDRAAVGAAHRALRGERGCCRLDVVDARDPSRL